MNELIKVAEDGSEQAVSARDLYKALEVRRDFSNWIKGRIEEYGFVEDEDYHIIALKKGDYSGDAESCSPNLTSKSTEENLIFAKSGENQVSQREDKESCSPNLGDKTTEENLIFPKSGENQVSQHGGRREGAGRPVIDYLLSVDMAKEIAMVENNDKGREIRRYLIKVEKAWHRPDLVLSRAGVLDRITEVEKRQMKFEGYAVGAYKKLETRVDGAYKEVLDNATANAAAEVKEYLVSSHRPSAHEAQLADLKEYLSLTIIATGDKRDKIDLFRLYPGYETHVSNPMPKNAFAAHVQLLYPQIKISNIRYGAVFSGCRFDY
jgi:phage anti-repressor protein